MGFQRLSVCIGYCRRIKDPNDDNCVVMFDTARAVLSNKCSARIRVDWLGLGVGGEWRLDAGRCSERGRVPFGGKKGRWTIAIVHLLELQLVFIVEDDLVLAAVVETVCTGSPVEHEGEDADQDDQKADCADDGVDASV